MPDRIALLIASSQRQTLLAALSAVIVTVLAVLHMPLPHTGLITALTHAISGGPAWLDRVMIADLVLAGTVLVQVAVVLASAIAFRRAFAADPAPGVSAPAAKGK